MRWAITILVAITAVTTALPFALDGAWRWAAVAVAVGIFWIAVPAHSYGWTPSLSLVALTLLGAAAVLRFSAIYWVLPGLLAALAAWDLSALAQRLTTTEDVRERAADLVATEPWGREQW